MELSTHDKIIHLLLEIKELKTSKNALEELLDSDPYARLIYEAEHEKFTIESFLAGELPKPERLEFEKRLEAHPQLKAETKFLQGVNQAIAIESLKNKLNEIHNELYTGEEVPQKCYTELRPSYEKQERNFKKWLVAASILFMIGLCATMFSHNSNIPVEKQLYAQYYEPFNAENVNKTLVVNSNSLDNARNKYNQGKFQEAIIGFNNLPDNLQVKTEKNFYLGLSFMELNSFQMAISKFKLVIGNENNEWLPQAYWYIALCYLQTGNKTESKEVFGYIVENQIHNYTEAQTILSKLK